MAAKIGVGIVGLSANGGWASTAHVPALRALDDKFALVGLSASSHKSAAAAAEKFGVPFHTDDPAELAARPDVELVVVTVKVPEHKKLVEAALAAGKTVYCEWPLGNGLAEAEALETLAKARGVKTFVGLQARSSPDLRFIKDIIARGDLGEILSTSVIGSGGPPWGGVATSASAYATDQSTGATMMTIPFAHTVDGLAWMLGPLHDDNALLTTRRHEVRLSDTGGTAHATGPDQIVLSGVLGSNIILSMHYRGGFSRGTNFLWEINGTKGDIVVTGGIGHLQFGLIQTKAAIGTDAALTELVTPDEYRTAPIPPGSMGYTVAHAYHSVYEDIRSGTNKVPGFAEAVELHRTLDRFERGRVLPG